MKFNKKGELNEEFLFFANLPRGVANILSMSKPSINYFRMTNSANFTPFVNSVR